MFYAIIYAHHANVLKTDAWKGVMEHRTAKSSMGLDDVPYFKDVDASLEEFLEMRSYFFSELLRVYDGDAQEKESALALIMGTLNTFYLQAMKAFGEKPAKELLGEFAAALPRIVCGDKPDELQNKLIKQRNELWKKGEAEKAAQEKEAAKKENKDKTDKAAKADAAQKT